MAIRLLLASALLLAVSGCEDEESALPSSAAPRGTAADAARQPAPEPQAAAGGLWTRENIERALRDTFKLKAISLHSGGGHFLGSGEDNLGLKFEFSKVKPAADGFIAEYRTPKSVLWVLVYAAPPGEKPKTMIIDAEALKRGPPPP